jgi:Fur family ferric uptake transcriptional regulator
MPLAVRRARNSQAAGDAPPAGTRRTRQHSLVAAELGKAGGFRTARQVHQALRARGEGTGLATVYRVLHELARAGEADAVRAASGGMLYRSCAPGHHHLLICRRCGRAVEVAGGPGILEWVTQAAAGHGYRDVSHQIEITGICPGCARGPAR